MKRFLSLSLFLVICTSSFLGQDYKAYQFPHGYYAGAINASGAVAGIGNGQVFLWTRTGGFRYLGNLGGGSSFVWAMNESGAIVGQSTFPDGTVHAFLWTQSGGMQELGSPLGGDSMAGGVNAAGEVSGVTYTPDGVTLHVFYWSQATGTSGCRYS